MVTARALACHLFTCVYEGVARLAPLPRPQQPPRLLALLPLHGPKRGADGHVWHARPVVQLPVGQVTPHQPPAGPGQGRGKSRHVKRDAALAGGDCQDPLTDQSNEFIDPAPREQMHWHAGRV